MLSWVVGGEQVTLRVTAQAHELLLAPIVGFLIKDRLGQPLFGDNTYLSHAGMAPECRAGDELRAEFTFYMPILPAGDYSISTALADGTQDQHVQHHWVHDAVLFKSEASSAATGLVGIPMVSIRLDALAEAG